MKRKYVIGLDGSGIDEFIRGIEEYKEWLKRCTKTLIQRLADEGYEVTAAGFQKAQYDGTNDSAVSVEDRGEKVRAVSSLSSAPALPIQTITRKRRNMAWCEVATGRATVVRPLGVTTATLALTVISEARVKGASLSRLTATQPISPCTKP